MGSSKALAAEAAYQARTRKPSVSSRGAAAEAAYQARSRGSADASIGQRAAFSMMTGDAEKLQYLGQQYGAENVRQNPLSSEFEVQKNKAWLPFDEEGFTVGDIADTAGSALEYGASALGAFAASPVIGAALGQVAGRSARQALADVLLGGSSKEAPQRALELATAGGEGLVGGLAGKALQGVVNLATPGQKLAQAALKAPGTLEAPVAQTVTRQVPPPLLANPHTRIPSAAPKVTSMPRATRMDRYGPPIPGASAQLVDDVPWASARLMSRKGPSTVTETVAPTVQQNPVVQQAIEQTQQQAATLTLPRSTNPVVLASRAYTAATSYLGNLSAKKIATISQHPEGLKMLKELAKPGLKTEQATILIKSLEGLLVNPLTE